MKKTQLFLTLSISLIISFTSCKKDNVPSVTTVSATIANPSQSTASITAVGQLMSDGGAPTTRYGFCLSKNVNPTMNDANTSTTTLGPNGTFTLTFGALDYSATYHIRAYAVNSEGVGYGNDISIETIPTAITLTKEATKVTMTAAQLNGIVNPKGKATKVWFEYSDEDTTKLNHTIQAGTFSDNAEINVSAQISDLTAAKVYNFTVKSENVSGVAEGKVMSFETYAVSDIDGNFYHSIKIGDQVWLKENLKVTHYNDGSDIPNVKDNNVWNTLNSAAYCDQKNNPEISKVYGCLYNAYAVFTGKLAPAGWHVGTDAEWDELYWFVNTDGGQLKEVGTTHWTSPNAGATNKSGFTAIPGGHRTGIEGEFRAVGIFSTFWTATLHPFNNMQCGHLILFENTSNVFDLTVIMAPRNGFGVRLVKD